jgi:hypothetical protein
MHVSSIAGAEAFTTKDGSTKLRVPGGLIPEAVGCLLLEGTGAMEVDGSRQQVCPGDAVLIPAGARHQITAETPLRFLCTCAPSYSDADTFFD